MMSYRRPEAPGKAFSGKEGMPAGAVHTAVALSAVAGAVSSEKNMFWKNVR